MGLGRIETQAAVGTGRLSRNTEGYPANLERVRLMEVRDQEVRLWLGVIFCVGISCVCATVLWKGMNGNAAFGSAHRDVLEAMPETEESILALVEEIKSRAKRVFASGNYPEAERLYDKAISLRPDAVLHANRSAARLNLNKVDVALKDADEAVALDPKYSKGHYRKGQAHNSLKEFTKAREAFEKGLELEPENKVFRTLAEKAKQMEEAAPKASAAVPMDVSEPGSTEKKTVVKPKSPASSGTAGGAAKSTSKTTSSKAKDDDDDEAVKPENLRGYRTLADGRKTTYFNNELSEEAKKLIGDIAPKKIEVKPEEELADKKPGAGSAWNYAGTFEAKDMTDWAKDRLKDLLGGANFVTPGTGAIIDVVKVKDLEGDASVTFVRGKKKYLFDFSFALDWEMELDSGRAKGVLKYPDVTPDNDDEYDTLLEVDPLTPPTAKGIIDRYIKSDSDGLQRVIKEKISQFMQDFKQF